MYNKNLKKQQNQSQFCNIQSYRITQNICEISSTAQHTELRENKKNKN